MRSASACPQAVETTLQRIGVAALPIGLMAVGAGLSVGGLRDAPRLAAALLAVRHVLMPLVAIAFTSALALTPKEQSTVVLFAALPTSSSELRAGLADGRGGELRRRHRHGVDAARHGQRAALAGAAAGDSLSAPASAGRWASAQSMCSRTSAVAPARRASSAATISGSGRARSALPSATARLRCQRSWPMRRIALPSVARRKSSSLHAQSSSSVASAKAARPSKSASGLACAYLFHGQTSWQSSQP